jgi:large subunit ribosomal protein L3
MGTLSSTVQNLRVVKIIADKNLLLVRGAIPGANGDDVVVRTSVKGQPRIVATKAEAPSDPKAAKAAAKPAAVAKK